MRYYSYNEYDPRDPRADASGGWVETVSEEEIRQRYWPYWYDRMCEKFGKDYVDKTYSFEECLEDWVTIHWAWVVNPEFPHL